MGVEGVAMRLRTADVDLMRATRRLDRRTLLEPAELS